MSEQREFQAEVKQLLDIVIHSLYTNRDIFLRELISNASDAIDRARFESLSNKQIAEEDADWKIKLIPDKENRTLTVSDNGIGMTREEVNENLGTIARSGTRQFLDELKKANSEAVDLIGQFGVGFYSAFMVAEDVTVLTRPAGGDASSATRWVSTGAGTYAVEEAEKEERGTDVVIHLTEEAEEYLEEWRLRKIVKQYSDFVEHPICMDVERSEKPTDEEGAPIEDAEPETVVKEETLNSQVAIWAKPKDEVTEEEHKEFYHHLSHDFSDPFETLHWTAEGTTEFRALIYLPHRPPFNLFMMDSEQKSGVHLYIKRVFITEDTDFLVPPYLRFLKGVVDSSDLPLNVSRETLQENKITQVIRKNIVKKVLDRLAELMENSRERYEQFWKEFGRVLKEGIHTDLPNRDKIADLALFQSDQNQPDELISLAEYVNRMPDEQKEIYYLSGDSREALAQSPHLEAFRKRGYDVLYMTDPIDDWVVQSVTTYQEKPLKSIAKGDVELETEEEKQEQEETRKKAQEEYGSLIEKIKGDLGDKVGDVRLSNRLTESACCLVGDETSMGVHMERIMKAMNQDMPPSKRILELNPDHPLLKSMHSLYDANPEHEKLGEYTQLLYDQALMTAGMPVEDPLQFSRRLSDLMAREAEGLATQ